ncbi:MAG: mechanosensitive ion channel family protein, partial [Minicystis sp.]
RGRATVVILIAAPLVHFLAHGLSVIGATGTAALLELFIVALLGFGFTGILGMLVFDIVLGRTSVPTILRDIFQTLAFLVIVLLTLAHSGVNPLSVLTTSAVLTAVIGLAFQNIMANLLSGIALQIDRTFVLGDWIQVGSRLGKIAQIRWRSTSILTREGDAVIIPNAQLLSNEVLNFSRPTAVHRASFKVSFHFRHPPGEVKTTVLRALTGVPEILAEPAPECAPVEFGGQSIGYLLRYSITEIAAELRVEGEVRTRLWYAAQRAGLEGPCPPRAVTLDPAELGARAEALGAIALFQPLAAAEQEQLAAAARAQQYSAGERVLDEGEPGDSLYLVTAGTVQVEIGEGSAKRALATLGPGDFFGEMSLLTGEPRHASCIVASELRCLVIDRASLKPLLAAQPAMAEQISQLLARRQGELEEERGAASLRSSGGAARSTKMLSRMKAYFHLD